MKNTKKNTDQSSFGYIDLAILAGKKSGFDAKVFDGASEVIKKFNPYIPAYLYRDRLVKEASRWFVENFSGFESKESGVKYNGKVLYSAKSNSDDRVIKDIFASGINNFDVASIKEVRQISALFGGKAKSYFMHPVKAEEVISESYFRHNVRDFSLDSLEELKKIERATKKAKDLSLHLRIKMSCKSSVIDLSDKFGIGLDECQELAKKVRKVAKNFGVCFHIGSQCMEPRQYSEAIKKVADFFVDLGVDVDSFDIGGGFPSNYVGMKAEPMSRYMSQIKDAISKTSLREGCEILCEPGRVLVAQCQSLLVRVEGKKGDMLHINDGSYGGLFDAGILDFCYYCDVFDKNGNRIESKNEREFGLYGPTCDSLDKMKGPFVLPGEIGVGDFIEIHNLGAYSKNLRTSFNGYDDILQFEVKDDLNDDYKHKF